MIIQWGDLYISADTTTAVLLIGVPLMLIMLGMEILKFFRTKAEAKAAPVQETGKDKIDLKYMINRLRSYLSGRKQDNVLARLIREEKQDGN